MKTAIRATQQDSGASNNAHADDEPVVDEVPAHEFGSVAARTARLSKAVLLALALAVAMVTAAAPGIGQTEAVDDGQARLGGDFPAFYAAGSIVSSGDIDELYDAQRQEQAQRELGIDGYLAFAYPPHVAAAYAPLSALDYRLAYLVHTIVMAGAFVLAVSLLGRVEPVIRAWRWQILAAAFTFVPLATAVGGGQNAALSVLAFAVVWFALATDREVLAGVAAGLVIYRPQYALPIIGLMFLGRHWRAVATAALVSAATWAATAAVLGANWVANWMDAVVPFVERDADVNAANSISILGVLHAIWSPESGLATSLGVLGAVVVVGVLMWMWVRPNRFSLADRMGAAAIGVLLISPHTMFYDAALLTIAGAALIVRYSSTSSPERPRFAEPPLVGVAWVLAAIWVLALGQFANDLFGWAPLAPVTLAAFVAFVFSSVNRSSTALTEVARHA